MHHQHPLRIFVTLSLLAPSALLACGDHYLPTDLMRWLPMLEELWGTLYFCALAGIGMLLLAERWGPEPKGIRTLRRRATEALGLALALAAMLAVTCRVIDNAAHRYALTYDDVDGRRFSPLPPEAPLEGIYFVLLLLTIVHGLRTFHGTGRRQISVRRSATHPVWILSPIWGECVLLIAVIVESDGTGESWLATLSAFYTPLFCVMAHELVAGWQWLGDRPRHPVPAGTGMEVAELVTGISPPCALCTAEVHGEAARCDACHVAYHPDCQRFAGGCVVYGCGR